MSSHRLTSRLSFALAAALFLGAGPRAQTPPVPRAAEAQSLRWAPAAGQQVRLPGELSSDPDDPLAVLTYTWTSASLAVPVTGATPTVLLPPGVHTLTLTVDDGIDGTATDDVQVTVVADTEPPQLTLSATPVELWPPNHKYHALMASDFVMSASDSCDVAVGPDAAHFVSGTSDEADDGQGDGNTSADIAFEDGCGAALVRSERAGSGDGRVYQLTIALQDGAGNATSGVVT